MSKYSLSLSFITAVVVAMAVAPLGARSDDKPGPKPGPTDPQATPITWKEFVERCANPQTFPQQMPPTNITISCSDQVFKWVPIAAGEVALPSSRLVTQAVSSSKWVVPGAVREIPSAEKGAAACPRFKEVSETYQVHRTLSCEEILGQKGQPVMDPFEACVDYLNKGKGGDKQGIEIRDTGRMVDTCHKE